MIPLFFPQTPRVGFKLSPHGISVALEPRPQRLKRVLPQLDDRAAITCHWSHVTRHGIQFLAAAFAATFLLHSLRRVFISAFNVAMCGATPLYFFVIPVTVRLTAPRCTRP